MKELPAPLASPDPVDWTLCPLAMLYPRSERQFVGEDALAARQRIVERMREVVPNGKRVR